MNAEVQENLNRQAYAGPEKRRFPRHRYIERLYIGRQNGLWFNAMTCEISAGGLSATTTADLAIGENVRLSPVMNRCVEAVVRRRRGAMFGFEFSSISAELQSQVQHLCESLPLFQIWFES